MHHHLSLRRKVIIMVSTMASLFLVALDQTIIATALGRIVEDFHAFDSLSWVITAYLITTTVTVPIAGKLSDLFGRRTMLLIGVAVFSIGSLLCGTSGSMSELILLRALQGVGGGIITANAFTIVADLFAARERGKWQGIIGAVFGLSSVVGPLLGGWLTDGQAIAGLVTDWRWTFFINVPIGIVAFILIATYSPSLRRAGKPVIDYVGGALLTVALATLVLAVDNTETIFAGLLETTGWSLELLRTIMFSVVAVAATAFISVERRAKEPMLALSFFKNRTFVLVIIAMSLFGSAFMGAILYLTQFNQQVFGATPTESGLMLLPMVGGMMIASIGSGQIIAKTGRYKIFVTIGFVLATVCVFLLTTLNPSSSFAYEAVIISFLGLGMGVAMPVLNLAVQNEFEQRELGAVTSSNQLFRSLGSTIGIGVFGALLTAGIATSVPTLQESGYVQALKQQPAASQMGSFDNVNTLLTLNMPQTKQRITDAANSQFETLPPLMRDELETGFRMQQKAYEELITRSFADSLRRIFFISGSLMILATIAVFMIKERPLKAASVLETPGDV